MLPRSLFGPTFCEKGSSNAGGSNHGLELIPEENSHLIQVETGLLRQVVAKGFYHQQCHGSFPATDRQYLTLPPLELHKHEGPAAKGFAIPRRGKEYLKANENHICIGAYHWLNSLGEQKRCRGLVATAFPRRCRAQNMRVRGSCEPKQLMENGPLARNKIHQGAEKVSQAYCHGLSPTMPTTEHAVRGGCELKQCRAT